jgi:hypothetical protein
MGSPHVVTETVECVYVLLALRELKSRVAFSEAIQRV